MYPFRLLDFWLCFAIERRASPPHRLAAWSCENNLEKLQRTAPESGQRSSQIQAPGAEEFGVVHRYHLLLRFLETLQPMLQGLGVVEAQILDVQHRIVPALE